MDRSLILDQEGNAVITCNEEYNIITIMSGEYFSKYGVRPAQKFSISGLDAIESLRDYLNSVCAKNAQVDTLRIEQKELLEKQLTEPTEETSERLKTIKKKLINLKGNSVNGRKSL